MKLSELKTFKQTGEKIACLTAYDSSFSKLFDGCGIDVILVGDSLGNVLQGAENTLGVSIDDMIYHTKAAAAGCKNALLIADLPYKSYQNPEQTLSNSKRLIAAGAAMVKFEGGAENKDSFKILQANNIPVCGHLGLQPQSVLQMGYRVQGRDEAGANTIIQDAKALQDWGVEAIVLECIPADLAQKISNILTIPTIGIGAGVGADGQVLVSYDMLGVSENPPKFVQNFLTAGSVETAVLDFIQAVKNQTFPAEKHSY